MRYLLPLFALALLPPVLAACTESEASRIGDRTFRIDSPGIAGGAEGPNRRLANQLCPGGYRVLTSESHKGGPDRAMSFPDDLGTTTIWTIKCL
jgi:hypothetical protein